MFFLCQSTQIQLSCTHAIVNCLHRELCNFLWAIFILILTWKTLEFNSNGAKPLHIQGWSCPRKIILKKDLLNDYFLLLQFVVPNKEWGHTHQEKGVWPFFFFFSVFSAFWYDFQTMIKNVCMFHCVLFIVIKSFALNYTKLKLCFEEIKTCEHYFSLKTTASKKWCFVFIFSRVWAQVAKRNKTKWISSKISGPSSS